MTRPGRARAAELALVGIAAVWGLTFTMVQDAVERLPVTAFLAYRFLAAAVIVTAFAWRDVRGLGAGGLRAGLLIGVFLTAGYLFQTLGLQHTSASSAGFITGLFVVLTPLLGAVVLGQRAGRTAWLAAGASAVGLFLLSGAGAEFQAAGDGLVLLCALAFSAHILATDRASPATPPARWSQCSCGCAGWPACSWPRFWASSNSLTGKRCGARWR